MWIVDAMNASGSGGPDARGQPHPYLENGSHEPGPGHLDWPLPDFLRRVSRDVAIHVDHRGRQLAGMSRASALEFSFFLSIPTMVAATGYDLLKSLRGKGENPIGVSQIDPHGWMVLAIGFVVSFVVAYASVAWFMAWVTEARVRAVRGVPHHRGNSGAGVCGEVGSIATTWPAERRRYPKPTRYCFRIPSLFRRRFLA